MIGYVVSCVRLQLMPSSNHMDAVHHNPLNLKTISKGVALEEQGFFNVFKLLDGFRFDVPTGAADLLKVYLHHARQ